MGLREKLVEPRWKYLSTHAGRLDTGMVLGETNHEQAW